MKTRSEEFINIVEGFKLGSLGAGEKFVDVASGQPEKHKKEPEPSTEIKITDFVQKGSEGFQGWIGNVRWMEEHVGIGKAECMLACRQLGGKAYNMWGLAVDITFFPGPDVEIPEVIKGGETLRYMKDLSNRNEAKAHYNILRKEVKKEGLKALGFTLKNIGKTVSGWKKVSLTR
jgi:hypothetical protein